jgi:excisionase family DNA binding protein
MRTKTSSHDSTIHHEPYVSPEVAAEFLGLTRETVIRMARARRLPAHPIKGSGRKHWWRFKLSELDKHVQSDVNTPYAPVRH